MPLSSPLSSFPSIFLLQPVSCSSYWATAKYCFSSLYIARTWVSCRRRNLSLLFSSKDVFFLRCSNKLPSAQNPSSFGKCPQPWQSIRTIFFFPWTNAFVFFWRSTFRLGSGLSSFYLYLIYAVMLDIHSIKLGSHLCLDKAKLEPLHFGPCLLTVRPSTFSSQIRLCPSVSCCQLHHRRRQYTTASALAQWLKIFVSVQKIQCRMYLLGQVKIMRVLTSSAPLIRL